MSRVTYSAPGTASVGPYSHAVDAGDLVFLSGQTAIDPQTGHIAGGGIGEQTERCFKNLFSVLNAAGLAADDVIKVNVYLTNVDDFPAMNQVYERQFNKPFPARTTIGVAALPLGAQVEVDMIARRSP
jgi:2-iminobutanoate/2-iminopropanoate deaminase